MISIYTFIYVYMAGLTFFICSINCHSIDDAKRLLADKKLGYEKNFRPVINQSNALEIYAGLELVSIREFDEVKEQLTITAFITAFWIDENMTWDPKDYGGLDQLVIESDNVWTPNLVLVNIVDKLEKIGDAWHLIRFLPNGSAAYYPGNVFPASCSVDVTYYPWDRHKCTFTFAPWSQLQSEIAFIPMNDKVMTTYFSENGAWTLYDSSSVQIPNASIIDFSLFLERKPRFVVVNVILPIMFMAFLNTMIYAIPVESGERISYSITVLLALAVFLTLVGDNLPKTSSPMSYFGYYLLVILIVSICITISTIFNVRLYFKNEDDPVPIWIEGFVRCLQCECRNRPYKHKRIAAEYKTKNKKARNGKQDSEEDQYVRNSIRTDTSYYSGRRENVARPTINGRLPYYIRAYTNTTEDEYTLMEKKHNLKNSIVSWKDVSLVLDKIYFILSFSVIAIATITFFALISADN